MSYNEQETRFFLIDPVLRTKGYDDYQRIRMETPAPVEPTGPKGRRRKGSGRTDYLLCVQVGSMPKPLPVGVLEAKRELEDPLKGMHQAKGYLTVSASMSNMSLHLTGISMVNTTSLRSCRVEPGPSRTFPITST